MKNFSFLFLLMLLSSCVYRTGVKEISVLTANNYIKSDSSFYIAIGSDGKSIPFWATSNPDVAIGSGKEISDETYKVFLTKEKKTIQANQFESEAEALKSAKLKGVDYLVYPQGEIWDDSNYYMNCTNVNSLGKFAHTATINLAVYDVKTEQIVNYKRLSIKGCPAVITPGIPIGTMSVHARYRDLLKTWMQESITPF